MVALFHLTNVLVKLFPVLITYIAKIWRKEVKLKMQKMNFEGHVTSKGLVCLEKDIDAFYIVRRFFVSEKVFRNAFECVPHLEFYKI